MPQSLVGDLAGAAGLSGVHAGDVKIRLRASKRQSLTKTLNLIDGNFPENNEQILFCINKLKKLESELNALDSEIIDFMLSNQLWTDEELESQSNISENYQDKLSLALIRLNGALSGVRASDTNMQSGSVSAPVPLKPRLKLPDIELPMFDNNPENFNKFICDLEKILDKFELTEYERFSYLRGRVSGSAREIVDSIPMGELSYSDAKKLLYDAFADKTVQQFSVIQKFLNLKSLSKSNLYSWISEIRVLTDQMTRLDISSEIFAQYFIWTSLSDAYKQQFISVINKTKPNLKEILDNSFEVINRIKDTKLFIDNRDNNVSLSDNSFSLATKLNCEKSVQPTGKLDSKSCWLCQSLGRPDFHGHKIYKCPEFRTAKMRKDKISELNGCIRCGFLNHTVNKCKYKFSGKCKNCQKYHAYFLCTVNNGAGSAESNSDLRVNSSVITISSNCISNSSNMIVPTFTTKFSSKKRCFNARVLYDSASQYSFVSEYAIKKLPHRLIQSDVELNISGFNTSKKLRTKVVELCTNIHGRDLKFNAIVAPKINAAVSSPHFSAICDSLKSGAIPIADDRLGKDPHVDILLGLNGSAEFPVYSHTIGKTDSFSQVFYTPAGVMLAGDMSCLSANLDCKSIAEFISKVNSLG